MFVIITETKNVLIKTIIKERTKPIFLLTIIVFTRNCSSDNRRSKGKNRTVASGVWDFCKGQKKKNIVKTTFLSSIYILRVHFDHGV